MYRVAILSRSFWIDFSFRRKSAKKKILVKIQRANDDNCRNKWKVKIRRRMSVWYVRLLILKFDAQCNMWFNIWEFQKPMNRNRGKFRVSFLRNKWKVNDMNPDGISMEYARQPVSISGVNLPKEEFAFASVTVGELCVYLEDFRVHE